MKKELPLSYLRRKIGDLKKRGKKIVFTNGCFDIFHPGHLKIIQKAKAKGDILVVGLNSDSSVRKLKGPGRPILNQESRAKILEAMEAVNYIVIFNEKTPYKTLKALKPHVLVKGGDWPTSQIVGKDIVDEVYRVKLVPGQSTTSIIEKIRKNA
ncbi:MAG: adenylyltransferase/cytidyltransferase family protein [Candidatus Omnitrophica bacterium]|nr:adenylyltransferase/cytidyltransferase family protein [Candidatus Omnitrophota bacterium]MBD3268658.1 adenylyltransferase/cytidyltransferase family protein [Candidatus Omnitrophota bacterium]